MNNVRNNGEHLVAPLVDDDPILRDVGPDAPTLFP